LALNEVAFNMSGNNSNEGLKIFPKTLNYFQFAPNLQLSRRKGSEVDLKAANDCFTNLGFEVA
jgi:hypothetical protein